MNATFGAGCFWGVEAAFQKLNGVTDTAVGYSGGNMKNPTYEQVCTDTTNHAEVVQIEYDPKQVSYEQLLDVFWSNHDPTTMNRQGPDTGTQYRSVIFYHTEEQNKAANQVRARIEREKVYQNPIITEIVPFKAFYKAEANHQNFYKNNPEDGYCRVIIDPKIKKLLREYKNEVKE